MFKNVTLFSFTIILYFVIISFFVFSPHSLYRPQCCISSDVLR